MPVRVAERDCELDLVTDLDSMMVDVLDALAQASREAELLSHGPSLLAGVLNHVLPVFFPTNFKFPRRDLSFCAVLSNVEAVGSLEAAFPYLNHLRRNLPQFEALEERRKPHLHGDVASKDYCLLWDYNRVVDLVGPDVLDAHGVQELEGRRFKCAYYAKVLVAVKIVRQLSATDCRLQTVGDGSLGDALDALGSIAGQGKFKGPFVVAGGERHALAVDSDEGRPSVLEDVDRLVDLLARHTRGTGSWVSPTNSPGAG